MCVFTRMVLLWFNQTYTMYNLNACIVSVINYHQHVCVSVRTPVCVCVSVHLHLHACMYLHVIFVVLGSKCDVVQWEQGHTRLHIAGAYVGALGWRHWQPDIPHLYVQSEAAGETHLILWGASGYSYGGRGCTSPIVRDIFVLLCLSSKRTSK